MYILERIFEVLKTLGTIKFWLISLFTTLVCTMAGFWFSQKAIENGYVERYKAIDEFAKQFISIEDWWLEVLLGGCIPMFLLFGLQFFLLRKNQRARNYLFAALPFLPKLSWLAGKPIYFMLATSSLFFGSILFLGYEGDTKYYWGLIIPISLFAFTFLLRYTYSQILSGEGFSELTYKYHVCIGWACLIVSLLCWVYVDLFSPVSDLWVLITELTKKP